MTRFHKQPYWRRRGRRTVSWLFRLLLVTVLVDNASWRVQAEDNDASYQESSSNSRYSVTAKTSLSSMTPNQFYKISPSSSQHFSSSRNNQPICGDGSPFFFYVTQPAAFRSSMNHTTTSTTTNKKVLIELMGGGACWDADTCQQQTSYLSIPERMDSFLGLSCSEIQYAQQQQQNNNNQPINMLCAQQLGDTDLTDYVTIVVPYCTQDVHMGSHTMIYQQNDDDASTTTVYHRGADNLQSVLEWMHHHIPHPSHIVLTGCSAGATALPLMYDLLNQQYNKRLMSRITRPRTQLSVVADSPVFLTPSAFLESSMENWNTQKVLNRIGFHYTNRSNDLSSSSTDYPTQIWNHVLKRGSNRDQWGFVSHTYDPVSIAYYQRMSGNNDQNRRTLDEDDDDNAEWYSELTASIAQMESQHKNIQSYWLDSEGHCSFGLYYPLNEGGQAFSTWTGDLIQERGARKESRPAIGVFWIAMGLGAALVWTSLWASSKRQHQQHSIEIEGASKEGLLRHSSQPLSDKLGSIGEATGLDQYIGSAVHNPMFQRLKALAMPILLRIEPYCMTSAYMVIVSIHFGTMLLQEGGFDHVLNNPALGPSAVGLSRFGIMNPSLLVYERQAVRLITSNFVCSGILTYLMVLSCCLLIGRDLEARLLQKNHWQFAAIGAWIGVGSNLCFGLLGNGASCSSVGLWVGIGVVYILLSHRLEDRMAWRCCFGCLGMMLVTIVIFPYNHWLLLISAVAISILIPVALLQVEHSATTATAPVVPSSPANGEEVVEDIDDIWERRNGKRVELRQKPALCLTGVCILILLTLLLQLRKPNRLYVQPYYTGCSLMHVRGEDVSTLIDKYYPSGNTRRRGLQDEDNNYGDMCGDVCLPHIASRLVQWGANRFFAVPFHDGVCSDDGATGDTATFIATKTFEYASYDLDVSIYQQSSSSEGEE